jgi:predicted transcriptional regulator
MTALELKNVLIHKIAAINDVSFLKAIQTIIDAKTDHEVLPLAREQKDEIMASKKEIEKGLFVNHESLDEEINAWLNEK